MRMRLLLATLAAAAVTASPALAQDDGGAGLYAPFPSKVRTKHAKTFVERLPRGAAGLRHSLRLSGAQLDLGLLVRRAGVERLRQPLPGPASARGGVVGDASPDAPVALLLALIAAALGAAGLAAARLLSPRSA
jgi:hypothetical protein